MDAQEGRKARLARLLVELLVLVGDYGAEGGRVFAQLVVQAAAYFKFHVLTVPHAQRTHPA